MWMAYDVFLCYLLNAAAVAALTREMNCLCLLVCHPVLTQVLPVDLAPEPTQQLRRTRRPMRVKQGELSFSAGFQPVCVVQLHPPAVPTAMAVGANWGM